MFYHRIISLSVSLIIIIAGSASAADREVAVFGSATVSVPAEVMRLTMTAVAGGQTAEVAYQRAERRAEDLITEFRRFGFGPDDYDTRYVVERRPLPGEKNKLGFLAGIGLSLVVDDFSAGTQMLDIATKMGIRNFVTYFDITDRRSTYERALRRALADARVKAEVLASESGVELGTLVQFEELSEPPPEYVYPQPLLPSTYAGFVEGQVPPPGAGSVRMAPQPTEIAARLRVVFLITE